jgi:hypothetical protein
MKDWDFLLEKIENKLKGWQGSILSLGGRLVLLNSVMSSVPLYWMTVYRVPITIRKKIDKLRRRFLWFGGSSVKKKLSPISWDVVCRKKKNGGMGVLHLGNMNKALLAKWLIHFKDPTFSAKWKDIIQDKYVVQRKCFLFGKRY